MSHRRNLMSRRDLVVSTRNLIKVHSKFPKELFRVNLGRSVNLRVFARGRSYFDVFHRYGMVMPKALDPSTYRGQCLLRGKISRQRYQHLTLFLASP